MCFVYDILYDIFSDSSAANFSPVQMLPLASSNATGFESNAGRPARPLRLSVCPGIKIGLQSMQWFITLYQASRRMHSLLFHPL